MSQTNGTRAINADDAGKILLELVTTLRIFRVAGRQRGRRTLWGTNVGVLQCLTDRDARLSDLAQQLSVSASVASRAVDELERDGMVRRRPDEADARACVISITDTGRAHLVSRQRSITESFATVLDDWTAVDAQRAVDVLHQLNLRLDHLTDAAHPHEKKRPTV